MCLAPGGINFSLSLSLSHYDHYLCPLPFPKHLKKMVALDSEEYLAIYHNVILYNDPSSLILGRNNHGIPRASIPPVPRSLLVVDFP
jgi:hypothetical protein